MSYRPEGATTPAEDPEGQPPLLGFPSWPATAAKESGSEAPTTADEVPRNPAEPRAERKQAPQSSAPSGGDAPVRSFQSASSLQGRQFAEQCDTLLAVSGFRLRGRVNLAEIGIEIDQEAVAPSGRTIWFEYKGSVQGSRPGLLRTDTLKKAIANGALLGAVENHPPFVVLTSHLPEAGAGLAMLDAARALGFVHDVICVYRPGDHARLQAL